MKKFLILLVVALCLVSLVGASQARSLDRAMISYTFDDGPTSLLLAVPILSKYGIPGTAYIITDWIGDGEHLTRDQLFQLSWKNGWEIGNHTASHKDLTTLSPLQIQAEVEGARVALLLNGIVGSGAFAYPFGAYNDNVIGTLTGLKETSGRQAWTEDSAFNYPATFDEWKINVVSLRSTTTYATIKSLIDQAVAGKGYIVFVTHEMAQYPIDPYEMSTSVLTQAASYTKTLQTSGKLDPVTISKGVGKMLYYQGLP
jgi:peptidoglycan/xylan/chitin deacetylase (PgdA/CDA1 family)